MKSKPYSVWTPNFEITSGGIRVLYGLMGWLLARGQVVVPNMPGSGFITIYPDVINGNPFQSDDVVWYLLNAPGVMGMGGVKGQTEFPDKSKVFIFSELYNTLGLDKEHIMFLPILDMRLFRVTNTGNRKHNCKFIGKGRDLHLPETEGLFLLDRPFAQDQVRLAEYLNECEVMYSYDNNSAMFEIARLCGCRVVIIPSIYKKEEFEKYEPGMNGISYGLNEDVELDAYEFRKHYINMRYDFEERLDYFIEETQS
jgi:O-antigen biosynthesis protein